MAEFPGQEPAEYYGEREFHSDDAQDDYERDVQHDIWSHAADADRI